MNEGDEGPSVEVKEEESKEAAEVDSSKETPSSLETVDSKHSGDKYSPKVILRAFLVRHITFFSYLPAIFLNWLLLLPSGAPCTAEVCRG